MRQSSPGARYVWLSVLVMGALFVPRLAAQQPSEADANQPPAVRYPPEGISLEEAIQRTLEHDPDIQRAEASLTFARGVTQEQRGAFDPVLFGTAAYSRRVQELSDAAKAEYGDQSLSIGFLWLIPIVVVTVVAHLFSAWSIGRDKRLAEVIS